MKYTENYNLKKPEGSDVVNIEDLNDNADIIDQALKAHDDALATKETPEGAQEKADAALNSAKQYTDQEVAEVAQELAAHKADIENRIDNPEYSSEQIVVGGIGNMPQNLVEGNINDVVIKGRTIINLLGDSGQNELTIAAGADMTLSVKSGLNLPAGKYILFYTLTQTANASVRNTPRIDFTDSTSIYQSVSTNYNTTTGIKVWKFETTKTIMSVRYWGSSPNSDIKVKNFMLIAASDEMFVKSENELIEEFNYFNGIKSVPVSLRVKTVGKNLFDGKKIKYYGNGSGYVKFNEDEQKIEILRLDNGAHEGFTFDFEAQIGQIYTLSFNVISNPTSLSIAVIDPDSNVNLYSTGYFSNIGSKTLTFVATKRKLTIKSFNGTSNNSPAIIQYLQLQAGSVVTGYKEYKETVQYISAKDSNGNILELNHLPNGVYDEIKNGKCNVKTKKKILEANDIVQYRTDFTNIDVVRINRPADHIFSGMAATGPGATILGNYPEAYVASIDNTIYIGMFSLRSTSNYIDLIVEKGKYADLTAAKNALVGTKLIYQLAQPHEINLSIDGLLQAFKDGTIYIEPYLKEEFTVTGTIINLPKPIANIDQIEILQNNVWTETTGTLSNDGKTITVSAAGKYRVFGPIKSEESLIPEVSYTVPVNLKAQVDSNTKAITTMSKSIIDLNDKVDILSIEFNENFDKIADLKGYIGYTEDDIYGVEVDFANRTFTRLAGAVNKNPGADFDSIKAFGGRKRCILTDDGVVLAYYGEPGYVETGKLTQAITKNSVTYPVGTPVQVMVEQPKFYYKVVPLQLEPITDGIGYHLRKVRYYVSDTPKAGFKVHPAFVRNGVEVDKIYLSAYEGSIYDESAGTYLLADEQIADFNADKLSSIANAKPASGLTQNLTRANTRKLANNRGVGWQLSDVLSASVTQILFIIEYASFNTQANIGLGVVNKPLGEGNESELTGATSNLGNASGMAVGTNGLVSVTYRGEENFWGNIWYWIDGLNIEIGGGVHDAWYTDYGFTDDIKTSPYKNVGFTLAKRNGYVSAIGWSETCDFLFLPTETLGDSSLPIGDYFYQDHASSGWRVSRLGGIWSYGSDAGGFCWRVDNSSATRYLNIGGRLLYVPQS